MAEADQKFQSTLRDCIGEAIASTDPIITREGLESICGSGHLRVLAARLKSGDIARYEEIKNSDWDALRTWLWGVAHIEQLHSSFNTGELNVKGRLAMISDPQTKFPEHFRELATFLTQKFSLQNWGIVANPEATKSNKPKKRVKEDDNDSTTMVKKVKRVSLDKSQLRRPPADHKIFGREGIMRHILRYLNKAGIACYALDNNFKCRDAKVFGNNGFRNGDWVPQQLAALRDGLHGERTAGIAGDPELGAWSIVVNKGEYKDMDDDQGDRIVYSSPGSYGDKADASNKEKRGTRCLLASLQSKKPVRVLRGQTKFKFAPFVGYRYDGLYLVEESGEGKNAGGVSYTWFRLQRMEGQGYIRRSRPNREELREYDKIAEGY